MVNVTDFGHFVPLGALGAAAQELTIGMSPGANDYFLLQYYEISTCIFFSIFIWSSFESDHNKHFWEKILNRFPTKVESSCQTVVNWSYGKVTLGVSFRELKESSIIRNSAILLFFLAAILAINLRTKFNVVTKFCVLSKRKVLNYSSV